MKVLGISIQEGAAAFDKIRMFRKKHGVTYPLLSDEQAVIIQKFGFSGIPQDIVIDTHGKYRAAPETIPALLASIKKLVQ